MNRIFNFGKNKKDDRRHLSLAPLMSFDINSMIEDFFIEPFGLGFFKTFKTPTIDVYEKDNKVIVKAGLPGIDKKNINLHLDRDILTISGETKREKEEKKKGYYYSERSFGKIQRSIRLPKGLKQQEIKAYHKDGVLTVEIPRAKEFEQEGRDIEVE